MEGIKEAIRIGMVAYVIPLAIIVIIFIGFSDANRVMVDNQGNLNNWTAYPKAFVQRDSFWRHQLELVEREIALEKSGNWLERLENISLEQTKQTREAILAATPQREQPALKKAWVAQDNAEQFRTEAEAIEYPEMIEIKKKLRRQYEIESQQNLKNLLQIQMILKNKLQ